MAAASLGCGGGYGNERGDSGYDVIAGFVELVYGKLNLL
jgi:hypothetical protein